MTLEEAIKEITSKPKWYYVGGITDSRLINTVTKIKAGLAKDSTIAKFLARFGYKIKITREVFREEKEKTPM